MSQSPEASPPSEVPAAAQPEGSYLDLGRLGHSAWWRYLLGVIVILGGFIIFGTLAYVVIMIAANNGHMPKLDHATGQRSAAGPMINYVALNVPSWFLWLFTYLVVILLHGRSFITLITPTGALRWKPFAFGFGVWFLKCAIAGVVGWMIFPQAYKYSFDGPQFLSYLPAVLFLTPIQCAAEEFFFRGYLLQAFGQLIKNIWLAATVNAFLFMLPHLSNPEVAHGLLPMALCYFGTGFMLSLLVLRTNSLEVAIGAHIANNIFDILFLNDARAAIQTQSIFVCTEAHPWYEFGAIVVLGVALYWTVCKVFPLRTSNPVK